MRFALKILMLVSVAAVRAWSSDPTPLLKADVLHFGYDSFPRKMVRPVPLSVGFIDDRRLAIAWISPDATKSNKQKEPQWGDAAHVHVVVIDATSGQKEGEKEWPTPFTYASPVLAGRGDGKFLICTDTALRVLSVKLDAAQDMQLPNHSLCSPSPTGRTLLVASPSDNARQLEVIDSETFSVLSSWTERRRAGAESVAVSDHWLVGYCGEPSELFVRRFDEGWHPLHVTGVETRMTERRHIPASFISDEVLAIRSTLTTLATVDGTVLFQISPLDKQLFGSPPISSLSGERFVIIEGRLRGMRSEPLDMYPFYADDRATVYGIRDHDRKFSMNLQATSPWAPWHIIYNVMSLSPDGNSLALISDGVLEVFAIPARGGEKHLN